MWTQFIKLIFFFIASTLPYLASAKCDIETNNLYELFKNYREQINTATKLEDLNVYFSQNFNQYYSDKLTHARGELSKQRYLNQYWDNLNTTKDVVIVLDYSVRCDKGNAALELVSILNIDQPNEGQEVELWNVIINYVKDKLDWKIDSFEYKKLDSRKNYLATEIKDNFVLIR